MTPSRTATRNALEQLIGEKYDVLRWIGGGGMADVFLARHRTHGGLFAVKVLAEHLAGDPRIVARFLEEARTAATLSGHPNIVAVFDVGEGAGVNYLIMPYIEGEDLSHYLERRGPMTESEALLVVCQVASALVWASERGIVHRDLKPSNIRIDRGGRVQVLDFGIAKAADAPTGLTTVGETPGTPYYMSPEQIRGIPCDTRSDLYSLGIVLFEMLSGQKPFTGDSVRAIEFGHLEKLPAMLSTMLPVSPEVDQVVNRLLEKDPARRFQSAQALLDEVEALSRSLPMAKLEPQLEPLDLAKTEAMVGDLGHRTPTPPERRESEPRRIEPDPGPRPPEPTPGGKGVVIAIVAVVVLAVAGAVYWVKSRPVIRVDENKKSEGTSNLPRTLREGGGVRFLVAAGRFFYGDDGPESPNKRQVVELPAFYVDATEVSNGQYAKFVQATGSKAPVSDTYASMPNLPVAGVTLDDARRYCVWAGGRLPTEQEWEKAARGTGGSIFPWGDQPLPNPGRLVAVDEYPERQSPVGALNMAGNVFEWTDSEYTPTDRELADMQATLGGASFSRQWHSLKGGSFLVKNDVFFRCYMRKGWPVDLALPSVGFRCVKDAK